MLATRESAVFIKSVDSTDHMAEGGRKNATYLAEQISSVIREVGAENIVQVVMDRANKACWPTINTESPHIVCACCTVLCMVLSLLCMMCEWRTPRGAPLSGGCEPDKARVARSRWSLVAEFGRGRGLRVAGLRPRATPPTLVTADCIIARRPCGYVRWPRPGTP